MEPKSEILTFEEIERIIKIFLELGFNKIRFTGGEPLARKDVGSLFKRINKLKANFDFEMLITTNGALIEGNLNEYKRNGLDRINFSLDSLNPENFKRITGKDELQLVLNSIKESVEAGFENTKINTVIMNGVNDTEIHNFCEFAIENSLNVRFIEFMPFTNNSWSRDLFFDAERIKEIISEKYELEQMLSNTDVARNYRIKGTDGIVSFISSMSNHFCSNCNRLRITSDGKMKLCLFSSENELINFSEMLRNDDVTDEDIKKIIYNSLLKKEFEHKQPDELLKLTNNNMLKIGG